MFKNWVMPIIYAVCLIQIVIISGIIYAESNKFVGGTYNKQSHMIVINASNHYGNVNGVIGSAYHEIGHWIWFEKLTVEQRKEYRQIYSALDWYATEYAETNVVEDFAETYEFYSTNDKSVDNAKIDFMKTVVEGLE